MPQSPPPITATKPRAPRRSRAVGEELLLQAAVHHRFISTWFVGKVELFTIVHQRISQRTRALARDASLTSPSSIAELNLQLGLALWLIQNGEKFKSIEDAFPAIGSMVLANFILKPHVATSTSLEDMLGHYGKLLRKK